MPDFEKVRKFEAQVEESLEVQIDKLRELDRGKSRALRKLKGDILREIGKQRGDEPENNPQHQAFSEDLRLTENELNQVFEALKLEQNNLFRRNQINTFDDFKVFIGLQEGVEEISFESQDHDFDLFDHTVDFTLPLGSSDQVIENYRRCFAQIEGMEDLRPLINDQRPKFVPNGSLRVEFTLMQKGKEVKYCATPSGIFEVRQEPNPRQKKRWLRAKLRSERLSEKKDSYPDLLQGVFLGRASRWKESLKMKSMRLLVDLDSGEFVWECAANPYQGEFHYVYPDSNQNTQKEVWLNSESGTVEREVFFVDGEFYSQKLYSKDEMVVFKKVGTPQEKAVSLGFLPTKKKTELQKGNAQNFATDEGAKASDEYLGNGNDQDQEKALGDQKMDVEKGEAVDLEDESEPPVKIVIDGMDEVSAIKTYICGGRVTYITYSSKPVTHIINLENGNQISTLSVMRRGGYPNMTEAQYLDYVSKNLDKSTYELFLGLFMVYKSEKGDKWNQPGETVAKVNKEGKNYGDCDDYAFLMQYIIGQKEGISPLVLNIAYKKDAHATCVWIEERDGKFYPFSICNFGFDDAGGQGYDTRVAAINALLPKFEDMDSIGIDKDKTIFDNDQVMILGITERGRQIERIVPIEVFDPEISDLIIEIDDCRRKRDNSGLVSAYEQLVAIRPSLKGYYRKLVTRALNREIKKARSSGDHARIDELFKKLSDLKVA